MQAYPSRRQMLRLMLLGSVSGVLAALLVVSLLWSRKSGKDEAETTESKETKSSPEAA